MPDKLNALWHTPIIPVLFLVSAIGAGIAMVIFESILSAKAFKREVEMEALSALAMGIPWVLGIYFILKIGDLYFSKELGLIFKGDKMSNLFLLEMIIGVVLPFFLFLSENFRKNQKKLFTGALLIILGLMLNRFNVSLFAIQAPEGASYFPHIMEILITTELFSAGALIYYLVAKNFPVFAAETHAVK